MEKLHYMRSVMVKKKKKKVETVVYLMTIPAFVLFFAFHTFPALQGVYYSFTNWNGLRPTYDFIGFKNYTYLIKDSRIFASYIFTFKFAVLSTVLVNIISLFLAVILNSNIRFKNFFRGLFFLPNILSILIVGFIFNYIFSNVIPDIGVQLGLEFLQKNILGTKDYAWLGIVFVAVWQSSAFNTVLYISGLQTVPEELYEASGIDGANKWQTFWNVTFPIIAPFFTINIVLAMKNFLMVFDHVMAMTGGGPGNATKAISVLIYQTGISGGEFAYQSANAVVYLLFIGTISIFQIKFLQKREMD